MVGPLPRLRPVIKPAIQASPATTPEPTPATIEAEYDEDGRRILTAPIQPLPRAPARQISRPLKPPPADIPRVPKPTPEMIARLRLPPRPVAPPDAAAAARQATWRNPVPTRRADPPAALAPAPNFVKAYRDSDGCWRTRPAKPGEKPDRDLPPDSIPFLR
ncbi:hypothetical protein ACQR1I_35490 [Bradyrhizobium sp. HKCCYLS2038]|uniref:hypothetical protein n=1 Tax=unclassified Bradyrhizobium TaxID=2631580 RepID=UPI003EB74E3B